MSENYKINCYDVDIPLDMDPNYWNGVMFKIQKAEHLNNKSMKESALNISFGSLNSKPVYKHD